MSQPNLPSLATNVHETLRNQVIDENGPGDLLKDFETLLQFIGQAGIPVSGKNNLLPMKLLPQLNVQMVHPIEIDLKRPQQKSYPNINGLYLLLWATGQASVERTRTGGLLRLVDAVLQSWRDLSPTERYFTLLESWLLRSRPEVLGGREGWLSQPVRKWSQFFQKIPAKGLEIAGNKSQELDIIYFPGLYTVALLDLFGFVTVQAGKPEAGKGWRIVRVHRNPLGDAMVQLLSEVLASDKYFFWDDEEPEANFGELQSVLQPFFPEWRQNLRLPDVEFQDGTYIFKVSLGKNVWRRIALPGRSYFESLSDAILQAFDFDNDHLYRFSYKGRFGVQVDINHPVIEDEPFTTEVQVGAIGIRPGTIMTYLYDFGDHWEFDLTLENIEPVDPKIRKPRILETYGEAPEQYPGLDDEWDNDWDDSEE